MSGLSINISRDDLSPLLARLGNEANVGGLTNVMGRAAGNLVKDWLYDLDSKRHRYGRNYYRGAADSVTIATTPNSAIISITQVGFRQRLQGGVIKPKAGKKFLTIPAAPEAYGRRAGEFSSLEFRYVLDDGGHLRPALVQRAHTPLKFINRRRKDGTVKLSVKAGALNEEKVMYWLVRQVTQRADSTVLPAPGLIVAAAVQAGLRRLERLKQSPSAN